MEETFTLGKWVTIGDAYAKKLGYEEAVGATGIIQDVMQALCGVLVLTGKQELVGQIIDIHKEDCVLDKSEKEVVSDLTKSFLAQMQKKTDEAITRIQDSHYELWTDTDKPKGVAVQYNQDEEKLRKHILHYIHHGYPIGFDMVRKKIQLKLDGGKTETYFLKDEDIFYDLLYEAEHRGVENPEDYPFN